MTLKKLENRSLVGGHFNVKDHKKFKRALGLLRESLGEGSSAAMFSADNLITWNRNLSFLRDDFYLKILKSKSATIVEKSIIWRTYILIYFCKFAINTNGDFMELGCYQGSTALQIIKGIDFTNRHRRYYLYDLFSWKEGDEHSYFTGHDDPKMYETVSEKFSEFPFVKVIKGSVPESFSKGVPDKIAFAHIDMNHPKLQIPYGNSKHQIFEKLNIPIFELKIQKGNPFKYFYRLVQFYKNFLSVSLSGVPGKCMTIPPMLSKACKGYSTSQ